MLQKEILIINEKFLLIVKYLQQEGLQVKYVLYFEW